MGDEVKDDRFSWRAWFQSFVIALLAGSFLNVVVFTGASYFYKVRGIGLVGLIPGIALLWVSREHDAHGARQGLMTGAIVVALMGGTCGLMLR